jgi:hypothetical protein
MGQAEPMDEEALRERFLARLNVFLAEAKAWLAVEDRVTVESRQYPIDDPFGKYDAPGLEIRHSGNRIASIVPLAGVVIGAEGRFDIKRPLDEQRRFI